VNHIVEKFPPLLKSTVSGVIKSSPSPTAISDALQAAVKAFDDSLTHDLFSIFPGGVDSLSKLSDGEIRNIINDQNSGGINFAKVSRCMQGSTVLIALIDPGKENLWVASLGDCQAGVPIPHNQRV
jgi:pyruvate dehydrogenase phosphatase